MYYAYTGPTEARMKKPDLLTVCPVCHVINTYFFQRTSTLFKLNITRCCRDIWYYFIVWGTIRLRCFLELFLVGKTTKILLENLVVFFPELCRTQFPKLVYLIATLHAGEVPPKLAAFRSRSLSDSVIQFALPPVAKRPGREAYHSLWCWDEVRVNMCKISHERLADVVLS